MLTMLKSRELGEWGNGREEEVEGAAVVHVPVFKRPGTPHEKAVLHACVPQIRARSATVWGHPLTFNPSPSLGHASHTGCARISF